MGRALLVVAIAATTLHHAGAQVDGAPGTAPGSNSPGRDVGPPAQPSAHCQYLLTLRDELQKHGAAITAANEKRADVKIACRLFRDYIATEAKLLKGVDTHGKSCGVPAQVNQQVRGSHAKAQQMGKQVCDAAARGPLRPDPPLPPIKDDELVPFRLSPERRPERHQYEQLSERR